MPDLLTHTLAVYPLKRRCQKMFPILLLGTILPDIVGRMAGVFLPYQSNIHWIQAALHTPISLLLISLLLSFFFPENLRKRVFMYLILGVFIHLFLDLFQKTLKTGYFWFFPFSFSSFNIPLIWPNDTVYLVPFLIFANAMLAKIKIRKDTPRI